MDATPGPEPEDRGGARPARLTFPELQRLELDDLLGQLIERAQEVQATQGRLRGLLQATGLIVGDLDLESLLRHVVEAARELVGARYAALGVVGPEGGLAQFVHVGMDDDAVTRIGHLPEGKGLLGALIEDPRPIRLERIADDDRSSGFPPHHPPMHSFLGVPIEARGRVFGNLYLAESDRGTFSAEDEELARALAATAGVAVENARLYESAHRRGEWLQANALISRSLLSGDLGRDEVLRLVAERSCELAAADFVTVCLPAEDGADRLHVATAAGVVPEGVAGRRFPIRGSLSGQVFDTGVAVRLSAPEDSGPVRPSTGPDVGPTLVVPLLGSEGPLGVLGAFRMRGGAHFTAEDLELASGFANQAAIAIELAEARAEQHRAAMLDDRERIAADLHDLVIQRLFAAGISLEAVGGRLGAGETADRVARVVDDLDATISQIRTTIFQLQTTATNAHGVRARLLDVVHEAREVLGFEPALRFSGLLDTLRGDVVEDLLAVTREALSNTARHAAATAVAVEVSRTAGVVVLTVTDDGVGAGEFTGGNGMANLRRRAESHGGSLVVESPPGDGSPHGTTLRWTAQL
ncbi:GAF domain-containing sensor histidine kinase [Spongisporangium articulatum]|uniref:GAF domain-containing sensor histidine kinase n=1 Tax=Spongisporangium articulatum TaxID=3362603 RepID=A0ABW8AM09_9ACTN